MFGDLEKTYLAILDENVLANRRNCSAILEKKNIDDNVGDLEKRGRRSYGDFVLEFAME